MAAELAELDLRIVIKDVIDATNASTSAHLLLIRPIEIENWIFVCVRKLILTNLQLLLMPLKFLKFLRQPIELLF